MRQRGLDVARQVTLPIVYKGHTPGNPMRMDIVVGGIVVVECKAVTDRNPIFAVQVLTHLRLSNLKLGLLVNFGEKLVKDGIHRVVHKL